ncbi:hypothetical protein [Corallococcus sp. Z5C101001]|uniref:hypothetical protein n=1 Tax=Corallococcus sp. Z5C101001 TaxID=2596829 RepID=UPI001180CDCF|nr:hypothetical protein [Corallococcus sp. Z5C101001]TSC25773.1 hypothetical protein FOF48_22435 [Corallococcus sp. Z5C101001]
MKPWASCLLAALCLLSACQPSTLHLSVKAPSGTNQGRPLYMLVRKVDPKQFAIESYGEVSARVFQPDADVLLSALIYPGTIQRMKVPLPDNAPVAVSFLFTAPDGTWQQFVNAPAPGSLDIELLEGRIRTGTQPAEPRQPDGDGAPKPPEAPTAPKAPPASGAKAPALTAKN